MPKHITISFLPGTNISWPWKRIADYYPRRYIRHHLPAAPSSNTGKYATHFDKDGCADSLHGGDLSITTTTLSCKSSGFAICNYSLQPMLPPGDSMSTTLRVVISTTDCWRRRRNLYAPQRTQYRTTRPGKTGTSIAIIRQGRKRRMRDIERIIDKKFEKGTIPTRKTDLRKKQLYNLIDHMKSPKSTRKKSPLTPAHHPESTSLGCRPVS